MLLHQELHEHSQNQYLNRHDKNLWQGLNAVVKNIMIVGPKNRKIKIVKKYWCIIRFYGRRMETFLFRCIQYGDHNTIIFGQ